MDETRQILDSIAFLAARGAYLNSLISTLENSLRELQNFRDRTHDEENMLRAKLENKIKEANHE